MQISEVNLQKKSSTLKSYLKVRHFNQSEQMCALQIDIFRNAHSASFKLHIHMRLKKRCLNKHLSGS